MSETKTIEIELPEDGIIRQLAKAIIGDDTPSEEKRHESSLFKM